MTSIIGFSGLTAEQQLPNLMRSYVGRIGNAGRALLCTVNDILDFSKLEAGQVAIRPEPIDIDALARWTLELFTPHAGAKDLDLDLDLVTDQASMVADPNRLRQILPNQIGNALKCTNQGGVRVVVTWNGVDERLRFAVYDTGDGIAADKLDSLFRRFSQVDG